MKKVRDNVHGSIKVNIKQMTDIINHTFIIIPAKSVGTEDHQLQHLQATQKSQTTG